MTSAWTRLRRVVGRGWAGARRAPSGAQEGSRAPRTVALTARTRTADGADLRLLLEVRLGSDLADDEVDRLALALVVPAAESYVRRHLLATLASTLGPTLPEVEDATRDPLKGLGVDLVAVDLVAAEHLLVSPSTAGPGSGE